VKVLVLAALSFGVLAAQERQSDPAEHKGSEATQHHGDAAHESTGGGHSDPYQTYFKMANFVLLVGALGYLIGKNAGPFFNARTAEIQQGIAEATRMKADAEARAAETERRMANLKTELAELRASARAEMEKEGARLRQETEQTIAKIRTNAEQELASALTAARQELRAHAAQLAVDIAEKKIAGRVTPHVQTQLVDSFASGIRETR
jgi:F-type H+-transporting ATPase subunit b